MRQRLEESTTEAQTLLSGYLRARVEMAELRPHASDVVARMPLYTVVMWRLSDVPLAQLRDAVAVLLSGLVLEQAPRRCLPARGYEAAPARGRSARRERAWRPKCFGVSSDADKLAGHVVGVGKNDRSCRRWCLQPSLPPTA